jgi:hypothetical protein
LLERKMCKATQQRQGRRLSKALAQARYRPTRATLVADQVRTLVQWLGEDTLALAGPKAATHQALYDFVNALLVFATELDQALAQHYGVPLKTVCTLLHWQS